MYAYVAIFPQRNTFRLAFPVLPMQSIRSSQSGRVSPSVSESTHLVPQSPSGGASNQPVTPTGTKTLEIPVATDRRRSLVTASNNALDDYHLLKVLGKGSFGKVLVHVS